MIYKPLPTGFIIKDSPIHGKGIFTEKKITDTETSLGITHVFVQDDKFLYRTPLGGFINHSDNPNCELHKIGDDPQLRTNHLFAKRTIKPGEEITVKYTMYRVEDTDV